MGPSMGRLARSGALAAGPACGKGLLSCLQWGMGVRGWLPEAPRPVGSLGRRKHWPKTVPHEVVSSSKPMALWGPP